MDKKDIFTIESQVVIKCSNSNLCNIAYQSLLPDFNAKSSSRSRLTIDKKKTSLIFTVNSSDITAFRASINEIINFGRIISEIYSIK